VTERDSSRDDRLPGGLLDGVGLAPVAEAPLPVRYDLREVGGRTYLFCKEVPGVRASVEREHAFSESEAQKLGPRVVLLDGVGQFGPLIDNTRQLYNLDHHEQVLRAFTLATCEQALVLVVKGLELDKGDWTLYANEPDLDTVLAIWVLLNYRRVRDLSPEARDRLAPLLRLEGAIDANGREVGEWCGLPGAELARTRERLDRLFEREQAIKRRGAWREIDLAQFTLRMLGEVDRLVYSPEELGEVASVEHEYGHVGIGRDKIAIVVRDPAGIYEVERKLRSIWGDRLGLIALHRDRQDYTLRRTGLADVDLERAYGRLNLLDPAVDGRPPEKRWGGSDEIGGSPRPGGSRLAPAELLRVLEQSYAPEPPRVALRATLRAAVLSLGIAGTAASAAIALAILAPRRWLDPLPSLLPFAGAALLLSLAIALRMSAGRAWLYGYRSSAGRDWLVLFPIVVASGTLGSAWAPALRGAPFAPETLGWALAGALAGALAAESWFRGWAHGMLLFCTRVQQTGGPWFLSRATAATAALYAGATVLLAAPLFAGSPLALPRAMPAQELALVGVSALVAGLALGMMRERSRSIWPGVLAQLLSAAAVLGAQHPAAQLLLRRIGL
jgi:hypothetical protein